MKITIKRNMSQIVGRITVGKQEMVEAVTQSILDYSNDFIPKAEGTLRNSGKLHSLPKEGKAIWSTPYAAYQYYGVRADGTHQVKHYTTPGTGPMWAQKAVDTYKKELNQVAQNAFSKGMNQK